MLPEPDVNQELSAEEAYISKIAGEFSEWARCNVRCGGFSSLVVMFVVDEARGNIIYEMVEFPMAFEKGRLLKLVDGADVHQGNKFS